MLIEHWDAKSDTKSKELNLEDLTYTSAQITTARRQQLERLRLKMTIERDEIVLFRDALDVALGAGLAVLQDAAPNSQNPEPVATGGHNREELTC